MKILLINPNNNLENNNDFNLSFFDKLYGRIVLFVPSLAFPMLAAVTPREHEILMIDENYQKIIFDERYDIVGISVLTKTATRSYKIAEIFRNRNVPVILGGCHPSILPEEAKQHADSVVIGEAEEIWPKLLKDFE